MSTIAASASPPVRHLHVGDFGKDLDDEIAALVTASLTRRGLIDLRAVVANLDPAEQRARLAKGTYLSVGLDVPVAVGTSCGWTDDVGGSDYQFEAPYLAPAYAVQITGADQFVSVASDSPDGSLHLALMSGFTDAAEWLFHQPTLFKAKVGSVTLMGGVTAGDHPSPDHTANNDFDFDAASWLYQALSIEQIPTTVLTRNAAYAAAVPRSFYDRLAETGHPAATRMATVQNRSMEQFWQQCNLPKNHPDRTLPWGPPQNPRDADWFRRTFCGGDGEGLRADDPIWPHVKRFAQYDALTVIAAVPDLRRRFFEPAPIGSNGRYQIIGVTAENHGVKDPEGIVEFLTSAVLDALTYDPVAEVTLGR